MPYSIKKSKDKWLVVNKSTGKTKGTHDSYKEALSQMRLLYRIEHGGKATGKASTLKKKRYVPK